MNREIIFAGAPYSNSAPLVDQLTEVDKRVRVISDHPANLVQDLNAGRCDVALIPVAHLFRHPELTMIEGIGVAADGPVRSVLLKCRVPVDQIRTVIRDPASATSNALAEVLLRDHFGRPVEMIDGIALDGPGWSDGDSPSGGRRACGPPTADAVVMIGDRALCSEPAEAGDVDLAEAWKSMTGLPFVFAVWAVRRDCPYVGNISEIARKAYEAGLDSRETIASRYAEEVGRTTAFWLDYLGNAIHYTLDERDMKAMELFREYCMRNG